MVANCTNKFFAMKRSLVTLEGEECPYLDTVNRSMLDFDFEKYEKRKKEKKKRKEEVSFSHTSPSRQSLLSHFAESQRVCLSRLRQIFPGSISEHSRLRSLIGDGAPRLYTPW